jgi:predicted PhzF superfamily epimerase YddE/YHI9
MSGLPTLQHGARFSVFADQGRGGNLAEVFEYESFNSVPDAGCNAKVCVFVVRTDTDEYELEFYSSGISVALCLHGTLAASRYLCEKYKLDRCVLHVGSLALQAQYNDSSAFCFIGTEGLVQKSIDFSLISKLLPKELASNKHDRIATINMGSSKLFLQVDSVDRLMSLKLTQDEVYKLTDFLKVTGLYIYYISSTKKVYARSFNPSLTPMEDPATGVAAGALVHVLNKLNILGNDVVLYQGASLNDLSRIDVHSMQGGVHVGGEVVMA